MSFKNLEERFLAKAGSIYTRYNNPDVLVTVLPNSAESKRNIKDDIRLAPVSVSLNRDRLRLKRLDESPEGNRFRNNQLLLQTGNTFAETRAYNPANLVINGIPGLRIPRHIGLSLLTKEYAGALQADTIRTFTATGFAGIVSGLVRGALSPVLALVSTPDTISDGTETGYFYLRPEDKIFDSDQFKEEDRVKLPLTQLMKDRGQKKTVGEFQTRGNIFSYLANSVKAPSTAIAGVYPLQYYNQNISRISYLNPATTSYLSNITGFNTLNIGSSRLSIYKDFLELYIAADFKFNANADKITRSQLTVNDANELTTTQFLVDSFGKSNVLYAGQTYPDEFKVPYRNWEKTNNYTGYFSSAETVLIQDQGDVVPPSIKSGFSLLKDPLNLDFAQVAGENARTPVPNVQNKIDYSSILLSHCGKCSAI